MLTSSIFLLIIIIVVRAIYNYKHGTYESFAFAVTIIIIDIIMSIFGQPAIVFKILNSEPYRPLLILIGIFTLGYWIYRLLNAKWFKHKLFFRHYDFFLLCSEFEGEIFVFVEIIATILAYNMLSQLQDINYRLLIDAVSNHSIGIFSFICVLMIIVVRFFYNLLLGNYKTFVFWVIFITTLISLSLFGSRSSFANNIILYVFVNQLIFRYVTTELNFYRLFAHIRIKEAYFAIFVHVVTALIELVGSLMIIFIFVNTYSHLENMPIISA